MDLKARRFPSKIKHISKNLEWEIEFSWKKTKTSQADASTSLFLISFVRGIGCLAFVEFFGDE